MSRRMTAHANKAARDETLRRWCALETACWRAVRSPPAETFALHAHWNATAMSLILFEIEDNVVTLRAKPAFFDEGAMQGDHVYPQRARLYRDFFQAALDRRPLNGRAVLAVDVGDFPMESHDAPVLSFQKRRFSPNVLIPDVDFLYFDYEGERDGVALDDKLPGAIFIGASTGGIILRDVVETDRLPRLAMARAFVGHPDVSFGIGAAVQCDTDETRALLEAQPYYTGPIAWEEQLKRRFVLSMDGNGATCSRVVRTLASNSVLIKVNSPQLLFYFHGLAPFEHFLPAAEVSEIETWIRLDKDERIDRAGLTARANSFAADFLTRDAALAYAAMVIEACAEG